MQLYGWLAKLSHWGNFRRVAKPLYYRLDHPRNFSSEFWNSPSERRRAVFTTLFTGYLEAAMPLCRTPQERRLFQQIIADKIVAALERFDPGSPEKLLAYCLERLRYEGNTNLLSAEEVPQILQGLALRQKVERSLIRKVVYRIGLQSKMAKFIYPTSQRRRVFYQFSRLLGRIRHKLSKRLA